MDGATCLDPTAESIGALMARGISGPVTMLNLVRLREVADYAAFPQLAPDGPVSGREALDRYVAHTLPFLHASGGELLYLGDGGAYLVGPPGRGWDVAFLVRQRSVQAFLAFATNDAYLAGIGHRTAAVWDARILPLVDARPVPGA